MAQGIGLHRAGRLNEAAMRYSQVVKLRPGHGEAWRLMGVVALQRGDTTARGFLERAINIDRADAAAHSALGAVNELEGSFESAYRSYSAARSIEPKHEATAVGLTRVALKLGRAAEAIIVGEAAMASGSADPGLLRALGGARLIQRDYRGAADAFEASLIIQEHADAQAYLAGAYAYLNRTDAAVVACERALVMDPSHAVAAFHLGIALTMRGKFSSALEAFERAIELGSEEAHLNLGALQLALGDYENGWTHLGWETPVRRASMPFRTLPMWTGKNSPGTRLLIWHEQGIGDTIQMARFIRKARELVGSITLASPPETTQMFRTVDGVDDVVDMNAPGPLASFDAWLPTIRLPLISNATQRTISVAPYLTAEPARIERFGPLLGAPGPLRVGLVWSGNPNYSLNAGRSCGLRPLEALHAVPGISWFALQQGPSRADQPENDMALNPINRQVSDFADTAAIIAQLDLVITVDTSVAHLAGALGRPAWVLLGNGPDWRWQLAGDVSPWYPTLRLFRRGVGEPWSAVIAAVAAELHHLMANGA